ncbi:MAG: nucleoside phosphorylase [Bacteroidota bacterium]
MHTIPASELILNDDGSVYHLHLLPEDIAETVLLVGDPERVPEVSRHFDRIDLTKHKREFVTHTGYIGQKRITVLSTGIGTDNIDIVMNELDTLANIDLRTRQVKSALTSLDIIRIGTSGALQHDIDVDSILISSHGLGLDALMQFYTGTDDEETEALLDEIDQQLDLLFVNPYLYKAHPDWLSEFGEQYARGITATCCGFYAPQGRVLRTQAQYTDLVSRLSNVNAGGYRITNFEMETAGIYALAASMGHRALSVNAILANRITNTFSANPAQTIHKAIVAVLEKISS